MIYGYLCDDLFYEERLNHDCFSKFEFAKYMILYYTSDTNLVKLRSVVRKDVIEINDSNLTLCAEHII